MAFLYENSIASSVHDVAAMNQLVWNSSQGRLLGNSILFEGFHDHFSPILILFGGNYLLGGTTYSLCYLYSFVLSLGCLPIFLMARSRLNSFAEPMLISILYLLFPPLHQAIYDKFLIPDLFFVPALTLLGYAVWSSKPRLLALSIVLTLAIKETGAVFIFGLGLYLFFLERRRLSGGLLAILGFVWIPLVVWWFIPEVMGTPTDHLWNWRYRPLSQLPERLVEQLELVWLPMAFATGLYLVSKRSRLSLICLPYGVSLLSFTTRIRYTLPILPIIYFSFLETLANIKKTTLRRSTILLLLLTCSWSSTKLGRWDTHAPNQDLQAGKRLLNYIPESAGVCADPMFLMHLSCREKLYPLKIGTKDSTPPNCITADYLLINRNDLALLKSLRFKGQKIAGKGNWILFRKFKDA